MSWYRMWFEISHAETGAILACDNNPKNGKENSQNFALDTMQLSNGTSYYQYEMDPEIISDKPGKCPKCEMDLTEIKKH